MRYFLAPFRGKASDGKHTIVIRGRDRLGKAYRISVTTLLKDAKVKKSQWNQRKQTVIGNPVLKASLDAIATKLKNLVLEQAVLVGPSFDIPQAWEALYKPAKLGRHEQPTAPDKIADLIPLFKEIHKHKLAPGYLRIYEQVKTDIIKWNKDWTFSNLNDLNLLSYEKYLCGKDEKCPREALHASSVANHFKLLKVLAKFAQLKGIKIDHSIFKHKVKYVHTDGGFALSFAELMRLWFYKPANYLEEITKDIFLFESFTGIRSGDISRLQNGDIEEDCISYRDKKNHQLKKVVTLHKFNRQIIERHKQENPAAHLFPPIAQQIVNSTIKEIAKSAGLTRNIRRGDSFFCVSQVLSTHCGRHSYASLLSKIGVPQDYVKAELGHSQGSITYGTYVHRDDQHELVKGLVDKLTIELKEEQPEKARLKKTG